MTLLRGRSLVAITVGLTALFVLSAWHSDELHGTLAWPVLAANTLPFC